MNTAGLLRLYQGQPGTSVETVYTATQRVVVTEVLIANTSSAAVTVTVYFVPSGGIAGVTNVVVPEAPVPANTLAILELRTPLAPDDTIQAFQGTADKVTLTISGEGVTM